MAKIPSNSGPKRVYAKRKIKRDFMAEPIAVGAAYAQDGFAYVSLAQEPYKRLDGAQTLVMQWRGECGECGADYQFETGSRCYNLHRYCEEHRGKFGLHKATPFGVPRAERPAPIYEPGLDQKDGLVANLFPLRRRLAELGDDVGASAVTLVRALYSAWLRDPIDIRASEPEEEQFVLDATTDLIRVCGRYMSFENGEVRQEALTAEDLI